MQQDAIISQGLQVSYRPFFGKAFTALQDVSFRLEVGGICGIIGENGAGKTTLLRALAGLIEPQQGRLELLNLTPHKERAALMRRCGVLLSGKRSFSPRWTVRDCLRYMGFFYGQRAPKLEPLLEPLYEVFGLKGKEEQQVSTLSLGNRQRLSLASAFVHDPELVLLDEPTLALDSETSQRFLGFLKERSLEGKTTVITSHDHQLLGNLVNQVIYLSQGKVIDPPDVANYVPILRLRCEPLHEAFLAEVALEGLSIDRDSHTLSFPSNAKNTSYILFLLEQHHIAVLQMQQQSYLEHVREQLSSQQTTHEPETRQIEAHTTEEAEHA